MSAMCAAGPTIGAAKRSGARIMDAYIYQAALFCTDCALAVRVSNESGGAILFDDMKEDSTHWPQGPYADGGGEADTPQHCDACDLFLENVLTEAGDSYVRKLCEPYIAPDDGDVAPWSMVADRAEDDGRPVLADWVRHYYAIGM